MIFCTILVEINLPENNNKDLAAESFCRKFLQKIVIFNDSADDFGRTWKITNNKNLMKMNYFLLNLILEINLSGNNNEDLAAESCND